MSVCFSSFETDGCLMFKAAAISACALPVASLNSRSPLSFRYGTFAFLQRESNVAAT